MNINKRIKTLESKLGEHLWDGDPHHLTMDLIRQMSDAEIDRSIRYCQRRIEELLNEYYAKYGDRIAKNALRQP